MHQESQPSPALVTPVLVPPRGQTLRSWGSDGPGRSQARPPTAEGQVNNFLCLSALTCRIDDNSPTSQLTGESVGWGTGLGRGHCGEVGDHPKVAVKGCPERDPEDEGPSLSRGPRGQAHGHQGHRGPRRQCPDEVITASAPPPPPARCVRGPSTVPSSRTYFTGRSPPLLPPHTSRCGDDGEFGFWSSESFPPRSSRSIAHPRRLGGAQLTPRAQ